MNNYSNSWSRRKFLKMVSGTGLALAANPMNAQYWTNFDPAIADIVARTIGVDTHNHIDVPLVAAELPGPKLDLTDAMKKSGLSAICMTFAVDYQKLTEEGQAFERFLNGLSAMDKILETNNMQRSLDLNDIQKAHKAKKPTVIQSVEGAHFLEGKIERLKTAYNRGLRHLCLLHDNDASVPLGDVFTNPPKWGGLTSFGADVIMECERSGILVDLSHCDNNTVNMALKITKKPVLISHTGLDTRLGQNEFMAKMMKPRLISKAQAKIVADTGGVIGVWTHLADSPQVFAENIKAMVDVAGIDHVAIGTDTKLTPPYRSPDDQRGSNNQKKSGETTNEIWPDQKQGFYYTVVDALMKQGFNEEGIAKIGGVNYLRIFDKATTGR